MTTVEINESMITYNDYLDRVITAAGHFCEDIRDSDFKELSPVVPAIIDGLTWIADAADNFVKLGKIEGLKYQDFQALIAKMAAAMENRDYVLLSDLYEFELIPLLNDLKITQDKIQ